MSTKGRHAATAPRLLMALLVALLPGCDRRARPAAGGTPPGDAATDEETWPEQGPAPAALRAETIPLGFDLYPIAARQGAQHQPLGRMTTPALMALRPTTAAPEWNLPPVDRADLFIDLDEAQRRAIHAAKGVGVRFSLRGATASADLFEAERATAQMARDLHAAVYDYSTDVVLSPEAFQRSRVDTWHDGAPDMVEQVMIVYGASGGFERSVTHGMEKLGLPDVTIDRATTGESSAVGGVLNLVAQTLAERGGLDQDGVLKLDVKTIQNAHVREENLKMMGEGAGGSASIRLAACAREDGDEHNRQMRLVLDSAPAVVALMTSVYGPPPDDATTEDHDSEAFQAAVKKARARLPSVRARFQKGLRPGERILVKVPFAYTDGREWMWVEVTRWRKGKITGRLINKPSYATDVHQDEVVEVLESDVIDYVRKTPGQPDEGNETTRAAAATATD